MRSQMRKTNGAVAFGKLWQRFIRIWDLEVLKMLILDTLAGEHAMKPIDFYFFCVFCIFTWILIF